MGKKWDRIGDVGKATGGFSKGAKAEKGVRGEIRSLPTYKPNGNVKCRNCGRWKIGHVPGDGGGGGLKCQCEKPDFPNVSLEYSVKMQEWHHGWVEEAYRVLKPNGIIKAFSGTRTFHRLASAMDEAGFVDIRIEAWCYGSGFPKSLNVSKALDKINGVDEKIEKEICSYLQSRREELGLTVNAVDQQVFGGTTRYSWVEGRRGGKHSGKVYLPTPREWVKLKEVLKLDSRYDAYVESVIPLREHRHSTDGGKAKTMDIVGGDYGYQDGDRWGKGYRITQARTPEAERWDGWGTAMKPSWEPVIVGRKPTL